MKSKKVFKNYLVFVLVISVVLFIALPVFAQNKELASRDSLFEKVSIDQLMEIKKFYDRKAEKLQKDEEKSLVEGKKLGESFLSDDALKIKDRDKIYIRISEYYIEEADREYEKASDKFDELFDDYEKEYEKFTNGEIAVEPDVPDEPKKDYSKAILVYEKLLNEYPSSDFADDALYSVAWLKNKMNEAFVNYKNNFLELDITCEDIANSDKAQNWFHNQLNNIRQNIRKKYRKLIKTLTFDKDIYEKDTQNNIFVKELSFRLARMLISNIAKVENESIKKQIIENVKNLLSIKVGKHLFIDKHKQNLEVEFNNYMEPAEPAGWFGFLGYRK